MPLSSLTAPLLALFMLGGFNWNYGAQTDAKGTAWVELTADENLDGVKVEIKGSDGNTVSKTVNLKANKATKITWTQKDRQVDYEIEIQANEAFTSGSFEVQKPIAGGKQAPLELLSDRTDIVDNGKIRYKTPFTAASRELQVYNTDGDLITEELVTDQVVEAGGTFEMSWRSADEVFMVKVTAEDEAGYSATDTRVPWSVAIPHTEVNFDSGKSVIKPEEEWKVAEAFAVLAHELAQLDRANQAVNENITAQLYIVGYTDTVGNGGDNQKLSEARAKAIAQYFFDKGAWCEIYYAGMGERGLAVETGDSVDEVRNRRALYILDAQKPSGGGHIPGSWKKLADARPRMLGKLPELPESYIKYKEEQRHKRAVKFGLADEVSGDGDSSPGDDDGGGGIGGDDDGGGSGDVSSGEGGGRGGGDGPPSIDGEPGGATQGCSVQQTGVGSVGMIAGLIGLLGLTRRRRAS